MKKTWIALLLAAALLLGCTACSLADSFRKGYEAAKDDASPSPTPTATPSPSSAQTADVPSPTPSSAAAPTVTTGFSIALPEDFERQEDESLAAYYLRDDAVMWAIRETLDELEAAGYSPTGEQEYAEIVTRANGLDVVLEQSASGHVYFVYENTVDAEDFFYYATVRQGEDAFWLCQFACLAVDAPDLLDSFSAWADTIKVE